MGEAYIYGMESDLKASSRAGGSRKSRKRERQRNSLKPNIEDP